jgi:hypothetical protein
LSEVTQAASEHARAHTHSRTHARAPDLSPALPHAQRTQGKANFFERRVGEYQKAGVMANGGGGAEGAARKMTFEQFVFTTDEDF